MIQHHPQKEKRPKKSPTPKDIENKTLTETQAQTKQTEDQRYVPPFAHNVSTSTIFFQTPEKEEQMPGQKTQAPQTNDGPPKLVLWV